MSNRPLFSMIGSAALVGLLGIGPASAQRPDVIENWQIGFLTSVAHLDVYGGWIGGLRATSAAIGNNAAAQTKGSLGFYSNQLFLADVGAKLKAEVYGVHGDVDLQTVGICNNASINNTGADQATISNQQRCQTLDPFAISHVTFTDVGGDVSVSSAAISNNLAVATDANQIWAVNFQATGAMTYAETTANVQNVVGDVTLSAIAIGNNYSITQPD